MLNYNIKIAKYFVEVAKTKFTGLALDKRNFKI